MKIQRINRDDREFVDVAYHNVSGSTLAKGESVAFTTLAASADGISAVNVAASNIYTFAGVALADVADDDYGYARAYGLVDSVNIFATGTSTTIAIGVAMGPAISAVGFGSAGDTETFGPLVSMTIIGAAIQSPGGYSNAFVRAL